MSTMARREIDAFTPHEREVLAQRFPHLRTEGPDAVKRARTSASVELLRALPLLDRAMLFVGAFTPELAERIGSLTGGLRDVAAELAGATRTLPCVRLCGRDAVPGTGHLCLQCEAKDEELLKGGVE